MAGRRHYRLVFFAALLGMGCTNDYNAFEVVAEQADGSVGVEGGTVDGRIDVSEELVGDSAHLDGVSPDVWYRVDVLSDMTVDPKSDTPATSDALESATDAIAPDTVDVLIPDALEEPVADTEPVEVGPCGPTGKLCSGVCFSATNPLLGCARADCLPCDLDNATAGCSNGDCSIAECTPWYGDCNQNPSDGCEIYLAGDANHCAACGQACPSGFACKAGQCNCVNDVDCNAGGLGICQTNGKCKCGSKNCGQYGLRCVAADTCG